MASHGPWIKGIVTYQNNLGSCEMTKNCKKWTKINMGTYHIYYYVAGILNFGDIFAAEYTV